jgi:DNA polymerase III delta subunit
MVYLFIGQDSCAKDTALNRIKEESFPKELKEFNLDILYANELSLKTLQEKLLSIPAGSLKRMLVIKNAQELKREAADFILSWSGKDIKGIILVLDMDSQARNEAVVKNLSRYARVIRFKEAVHFNAFNLGRRIEEGRAAEALKILSQLLKDGEPPERILGGLRYSIESGINSPAQAAVRLKLLLSCDIEIKTGKLKPVFALEKLVVSLCALG